jgi:BMFP domain-containing protein YqiC
MQTDHKLLDDLARLFSGAAGALSGVKAEVEEQVRVRLEQLLSRMDLVQRDEFDALKAMVAAARADEERMARLEQGFADMESRLAALESRSRSQADGQPITSDSTHP